MAWLIGLAWRDTYDSMAWVRASIPVAAVIEAGSLRVRAGSRMARRGNSNGLTMTVLNSVRLLVNTVDAVHSLPVPEVVGMAKIGNGGLTSLS
ncbi:hypothetical protein D3C79_968200 [compost metagenome]